MTSLVMDQIETKFIGKKLDLDWGCHWTKPSQIHRLYFYVKFIRFLMHENRLDWFDLILMFKMGLSFKPPWPQPPIFGLDEWTRAHVSSGEWSQVEGYWGRESILARTCCMPVCAVCGRQRPQKQRREPSLIP